MLASKLKKICIAFVTFFVSLDKPRIGSSITIINTASHHHLKKKLLKYIYKIKPKMYKKYRKYRKYKKYKNYCILLEYFWDTFGNLLGYFWESFGILLGYFCDTFGILLGNFCYFCNTFPLIFHSFPLLFRYLFAFF